MTNILATGIKSTPHLAAFDALAENRFDTLDLTPLLIYMIDTVPAAALPFLATQFDVTGFKGWFLATTEQDQRNLIKKAVELHRYKGTPYAIKEALKSVGFGGASILEGTNHLYNGYWSYDGEFTFGSVLWPNFSITYDLGADKGLSTLSVFQMGELVKVYKNERSRLVEISFTASLTDEVDSSDDPGVMAISADDFQDTVSGGVLFDGTYIYDGNMFYGSYENQTTKVHYNVTETLPLNNLSYSGYISFNGVQLYDTPPIQGLTDALAINITNH